MQKESGDDYIRRIATFIRTHEASLAQGGLARRRRTRKPEPASAGSALNPLTWFGGGENNASNANGVKPVTFTTDTHRLFYLLVRLEALGLDVGSLDVRVEHPARPMTYVNVFRNEKADVLSLSSFRSGLSGISKLSLGGGWWGRTAPPTVDVELKYIYSSFNKLPALKLEAPGPKAIDDEAADAPNALPLDVFRTIEVLECVDVDPRTLLGWDRLSQSLRSLTIKKSGLEDISDVFITAVLEDQARREGKVSSSRSRQVGSESFSVPETVTEEAEGDVLATPTAEAPSTGGKLSSLSWAFLKLLSLSDNALTFIPTAPLPYLTSVTHLDLSSNLLVSVPPGLSALYNLISLDLSDNMIDSVLGIYTQLGQILSLNLARNRLESLCGLERLLALERVDLRHNLVEESAEVGRLATLPHIQAISVEGNPLVEYEEGWRIRCFTHFWNEGKEILLDSAPAGFYEKRHMASPPPEQMSSTRPLSVAAAPSPPAVAVGSVPRKAPSPFEPSPATSEPSSSHASPHLNAVGKKKKKAKRVVNLDGDGEHSEHTHDRHRKMFSEGGPGRVLTPQRSPRKAAKSIDITASPPSASRPLPSGSGSGSGTKSPTFTPSSPAKAEVPTKTAPKTKGRHSRYMTEFASPSPSPSTSPVIPEEGPSSPSSPPSSDVRNIFSGSSTMGRRSMTIGGKSAKRRARVSASVYEPDGGTSPGTKADDANYGPGPETEAKRQLRQADAYRAKIEALRNEVGEGWLKVFSQSGLGSPSMTANGAANGR
jgi:hypothetical protein